MERKSFKSKSGLLIKHYSDAATEAAKEVNDNIIARKEGTQLALMCQHPKINQVLLGGWRFRQQYAICGASGSGKSYYLNLLYQDFINPLLNGNFRDPFIILHFNFEMASADEVLRTVSSGTHKSYRELISADTMLSATDHDSVKKFLDKVKDSPIYFVETMANVQQIYETIMDFQARFPQHRIVIGMDHTLLASTRNEKSEVELVTRLSRMFLSVRKKIESMNLLVVQLNDKIEDPQRISSPALHYPKKMDIHGAKAVFRDADAVIVLHAPEKLGIELYGRKQYPTKDLIAFHLLKGRMMGDGVVIRLKSYLGQGKITQWEDTSSTGQFNLGIGS